MHDIPMYRLVHLVVDDYRQVQRTHVEGPEDAAAILCDVFDSADCEQVSALFLDAQNWLIGILSPFAIGSLDTIQPRQIFHPAILAGAASVILAHNHLGGDPAPSAEDGTVTRRLVDAGNLLEIEVRDHIIVGHGSRFCSLLEGWPARVR